MDLGGWLRSLGLGKYEAAFHENEIDETVLRSLTDEHLKQLGVTNASRDLSLTGWEFSYSLKRVGPDAEKLAAD
jgi:hypothetical protein